MNRRSSLAALAAPRMRVAWALLGSATAHVTAAGLLHGDGRHRPAEPPPIVIEIVELTGTVDVPPAESSPLGATSSPPRDAPPPPPGRTESPRNGRRVVSGPRGSVDRLTLSAPIGVGRHLLLDHGLTLGEHTPRIADVSHSRFVRSGPAIASSGADPSASTADDAATRDSHSSVEAEDPSALPERAGTDDATAEHGLDDGPTTDDTEPSSASPAASEESSFELRVASDTYAVRVGLGARASEGAQHSMLAVDLAAVGLEVGEASVHVHTRRERTRVTAIRSAFGHAELEARIVGAANARGIELRFEDEGEFRVASAPNGTMNVRLRGGDVAFGDAPRRLLDTALTLLIPTTNAPELLRVVPLEDDRGELRLSLSRSERGDTTVVIEASTSSQLEGPALLRLAETALALPVGSLVAFEPTSEGAFQAGIASGQAGALAEALARR